MITTWYVFASFMLITYIVLDGRNFGAGMLHWLVARTPSERRQVVAAIGPLWSWHEVWLVSFGGTLFVAFPKLMASAFAGYYLALFLILWCLILRGISLEVGGHINDLLWQGFWDFVFVMGSFLLALLFGVAGGNLARGVPVDANGNFTMSFFTDFRIGGNVGLLDWYTVSVGAFAVIMLAAHGATYLVLKTEGPVHDRSERYAKMLWLSTIPLFLIVSAETWHIRPGLISNGLRNPFSWMGVVAVIVSGVALITGIRKRMEMRAFLGSNFLIIGLLGTGAATIFPVMLFSTLDPANSLTATSASTSHKNLVIGMIWWPVALALAAAYFVYISKIYAGKVNVPRDNQGFY